MVTAEPEPEPEPEPGGIAKPADMATPDGYDESDARELFDKCDVDGSGCINPDEFRTAMQQLAPGMPANKLEEGVKELDADGNGEITWVEFSTWWFRQCQAQQAESASATPTSAGSASPKSEKIVSMGQMVKTAMTVNRMAAKLKTKAADAKNKRAMRQIFVNYAEAFGEEMAEAQMIRNAFEKIDADKSGFIDGKRSSQCAAAHNARERALRTR